MTARARDTDDAVRARAAGKDLTARRTVWRLELGAHCFRCVLIKGRFAFQHRSAASATWETWNADADPLAALSKLVSSASVARVVAEVVASAQGAK